MLRSVLHCTRRLGAVRRSLCAQLTPLYQRRTPVATSSVGGGAGAKGREGGAGIVRANSVQQLVEEIAAIKEKVDVLSLLAQEVKENEDICSLFCSRQIVCEVERDFSQLFIRSVCGDSTGDEKYIFVQPSGEITSEALQLPDIAIAVVKEVTIHMPPSQLEPPVEVHLYLSNGYLLACSQDPDRTSSIQTLQGIEHVLDSATWFLRDPITMGTRVAFLRPFTHQQLVVHCSANIPLQLDPESTISTPNLRFQAI